jgi:hypothetical protein
MSIREPVREVEKVLRGIHGCYDGVLEMSFASTVYQPAAISGPPAPTKRGF